MSIKIVFLLIILFVIFDNYRRREKMLNRIGSEFGNKPKNINDELSMAVLYEYYENRKKEEGNFEEIDKLTWMDLDMDSVFKRTNYILCVPIFYFIKVQKPIYRKILI